jgi:hypothetical protein
MAPRNRQAVPPQVELPTLTETNNPPDNAPARRSRTRTQTTGTLQDGEEFDLDNISGDEDDYEQLPSDHGCDVDSPARGGHVNDPDAAPLPKTTAMDIRHFFDKSGDKVICKVCRQVLLGSWYFQFL